MIVPFAAYNNGDDCFKGFFIDFKDMTEMSEPVSMRNDNLVFLSLTKSLFELDILLRVL